MGGGSRRGVGGGGGGWIPKSTWEIRAGIKKQLGFNSWKGGQSPNADMAEQDGDRRVGRGGAGGVGGGGGGRRGPRIYLGTPDRNRNQLGLKSWKYGYSPNAGIAEQDGDRRKVGEGGGGVELEEEEEEEGGEVQE